MTKHQSEPNAQPAREARITEGVRDMLAILEDPTATEDEKSMAASTIVEAVAPDIMEAAQPASDCTYCNGTGLVQVHDQSNWQTEVCPCCKWKRQPPASEPSESLSDNTVALIELLKARETRGIVKYGVTLDRTDLQPTEWMQHAIEELLDGAAYLQGLKRTIGHPAAPAGERLVRNEQGTATLLAGGRLGCLDCGEPYGSPRFPDLVIDDAAWLKISPNGDGGGLLCPNCICARLERAGLSSVKGVFRSGAMADFQAAGEREEVWRLAAANVKLLADKIALQTKLDAVAGLVEKWRSQAMDIEATLDDEVMEMAADELAAALAE
jgi:hypothetical protein